MQGRNKEKSSDHVGVAAATIVIGRAVTDAAKMAMHTRSTSVTWLLMLPFCCY